LLRPAALEKYSGALGMLLSFRRFPATSGLRCGNSVLRRHSFIAVPKKSRYSSSRTLAGRQAEGQENRCKNLN
jgi:hypothetical protein